MRQGASASHTSGLTAATTFTDVSEHDVFGLLYAGRIRTASLTADTRVQDNLRGINYFVPQFSARPQHLGASSRNDDYISRLDASPRFSAMTFWFTRYQTLTDAWSQTGRGRRRPPGQSIPRSSSILAVPRSAADTAVLKSAAITGWRAQLKYASIKKLVINI